LEIFCLGILLSALGHFVLSEYDSGIAVQLSVILVGIFAMCLTAIMIDWYKTMSREPTPQTAAAGATRGNRISP
jgi:OpgC protein